VLHTTRAGVVQAGADARRQLKALIITAPSHYGTPCGGALAPAGPRLRRPGGPPTDPVEHRATMRALALTAQRALAARADAHQLEAELRQLVMVMAPTLLLQPGIGPVTAA
jgi:hypothetical protein